MGPLVNDKVERLDDGTPLRPLDEGAAEDKSSARPLAIAGIAAALVVLGGVVKKFFGTPVDNEADNRASGFAGGGGAEKSKITLVASRDQMPPATESEAADDYVYAGSQGGDAEVIEYLSTPLSRAIFQFNASALDIQLRPVTAVPVNDNETLYGFTPGVGITLPESGSFTGGSGGAGHGGSGGGGRSGDETNPRDASDGDGDALEDDSTDSTDDRNNHRPTVTGPVRLPSQHINMSVLISMSALLAGARDADGDELGVVNLTASGGTLVAHGRDAWLYTPERGANESVSFTYDVTDQSLSVAQTAMLQFTVPPPVSISGTDGDDVLVGTSTIDTIDAGDGNDIVIAREHDDVIYGRGGNDRIVGGDGDDVIFADAGDDQIFAGRGNDVVFAGIGNDLVQGDEGDDVLFGEEGDDIFVATERDDNDVINGGPDTDTYSAIGTSGSINVDLARMRATGPSIGNDTLIDIENVVGGLSNDQIFGSSVANLLDGSGGDDVIQGSGGDDHLLGGDGDDIFIATVDDGNDAIYGGDGVDTLELSTTTAPATVDLSKGASQSAETGYDTLTSIENVKGSTGADEITGNDEHNILDGSGGDDVIQGNGGDDHLLGDEGNDTFIAAPDDGHDTIDGGDGDDTYDAAATLHGVTIDLMSGTVIGDEIGSDTIWSVENASGGAGDDTIVASEAVNVLTGGQGNDVFVFEASTTGKGNGSRDKIMDFEVGDRIDIKDLSRDAADALDDLNFKKFVLISQGAEFTDPAQIRFRYEGFGSDEMTIIEGNIDDDFTDHEFEIEIRGHYELSDSDLYDNSGNSNPT